MNYINLIGIGTSIGIIAILVKAYKDRDNIKINTAYILNDFYTYYQSITQKSDSITNVQIIKNETNCTDPKNTIKALKYIDITKTYKSVPYNLDLTAQDLLKITYSYKGNEYIIILNQNNSTQFPLYTESELECSDINDELFTSAIITTRNNEYITDFTDILKKYAGPKKDFYKGKSIPFNISFIHELHDYINRPYQLVMSNVMGDEIIINLLDPNSFNI